MRIELPKSASVTLLLYIILGACLYAAPKVLLKLGYIDSADDLSLLNMLGFFIVFFGTFGAFLRALQNIDEDRK